jgi:hypothetical protein
MLAAVSLIMTGIALPTIAEEAEEEPAEEGLGVVSLSRGAMRLG